MESCVPIKYRPERSVSYSLVQQRNECVGVHGRSIVVDSAICFEDVAEPYLILLTRHDVGLVRSIEPTLIHTHIELVMP